MCTMIQRGICKGALLAIVSLLGIMLLLAAACSSGVPQSEYDAVKAQLAAKEKEVAEIQKQSAAKETAAPKSAVPVIGSVSNAPPRATATPLPPGATPPPPPKPVAPEVKALFLDVNTVTAGAGESKYNVDADKFCATSSVFRRGMHLVWLMEGYEASTGKELQTANVKTAMVKLPHGENINMRYGRHGATDDSPWFWSGAWDIPPDYPLGILDYEVEVTTVDGKKDTYKVWGAHNPARSTTNRLTIIE